MRIPVIYSQLMVAESLHAISPSAQKPGLVAQALRNAALAVDFVEPEPAKLEDLQRVHEPRFVVAVLAGREDNGFGNRSQEIARSLPFTNGSLITGAKIVLLKKYPVAASLSSGFHHAKYSEASGFCTFNGLMVTAAHLIFHSLAERIAIIDVDYHYGDGTDDLLEKTGLGANVLHVSFGKTLKRPDQADAYLERMRALEAELERFQPNLIIYSAGVDAHIEDPLGGMLTTEQLCERDEIMFGIAKRLSIPVVFNLAGGYQRDPDGGIQKVVSLHLATFEAAFRVHASQT